MIVTTTENIPGFRRTRTLGQVFGVVVRSRGLGGNIVASLRSIVGGEIHEYTQLLEETRRQAVDRLVRRHLREPIFHEVTSRKVTVEAPAVNNTRIAAAAPADVDLAYDGARRAQRTWAAAIPGFRARIFSTSIRQ